MRQTPDPTAMPQEPAAWITTGTPMTGPQSSDLKTAEMLATIERLNVGTSLVTVGPDLAGRLLFPDGSLGDPRDIPPFAVAWQQEQFDRQLAVKSYLILYWCARLSTQTIWACDEALALAVHHALMASGGVPTPATVAAYAAITAAAVAREAASTPPAPTVEAQVADHAARLARIEQALGLE